MRGISWRVDGLGFDSVLLLVLILDLVLYCRFADLRTGGDSRRRESRLELNRRFRVWRGERIR